jgi:hypothetical protein
MATIMLKLTLLERLIVVWTLIKFSALNETRKFIAVPITARHWLLPSAGFIDCTLFHSTRLFILLAQLSSLFSYSFIPLFL